MRLCDVISTGTDDYEDNNNKKLKRICRVRSPLYALTQRELRMIYMEVEEIYRPDMGNKRILSRWLVERERK